MVASLRDAARSVLFVSHRLERGARRQRRASYVLKDGRLVADLATAGTPTSAVSMR